MLIPPWRLAEGRVACVSAAVKNARLQPPSHRVGHLPRTPSVFCPSLFSRWPFLFWFPPPPEHTMATPLEDVGKQVGRSRPLPVALQGLLIASGHPPFLPPSPPGMAGCPAPGRLHSFPARPLPGSHRVGAWGGHRAGQHHRSHRGTDRVLYR